MLKQRKKCEVKDRFLKPCWALGGRLQDDKGIHVETMSSIKTGEYTRDLLVHKKRTNGRGLCLNFCPFCGESVAGLYEKA